MALIKIITLTLLFTFFIIIKCDAQNKENNATTLQGNFNKYDFLDFYYLDSIDNVESKMINYFKKTYFKKRNFKLKFPSYCLQWSFIISSLLFFIPR